MSYGSVAMEATRPPTFTQDYELVLLGDKTTHSELSLTSFTADGIGFW